jgi:undecaprenyl diphosphate synthase|tara:strand:- start:1094 stop:1762 length:669 start_codon:yes stop_codon:yes gene_type:complete
MNTVNHVAFIMDGNGRWGKNKNKGRNYGHLKGVEVVQKIVKSSIKLKIPIITFYVFSSENWKRPKNERSYLFKLIKTYFKKEIKNIVKQGIKINILGEFKKFSSDLKLVLRKTVNLTKKNNKIIVNLAINYGSKMEIFNAFKKSRKKLNLKNFEENLYTKNIINPDILIRTGGYQRLSNFLLWQMAYTELFFLKKLWPDFNSADLLKIIKKFKKIKRNYGNI